VAQVDGNCCLQKSLCEKEGCVATKPIRRPGERWAQSTLPEAVVQNKANPLRGERLTASLRAVPVAQNKANSQGAGTDDLDAR
jgi:hypothetical protein